MVINNTGAYRESNNVYKQYTNIASYIYNDVATVLVASYVANILTRFPGNIITHRMKSSLLSSSTGVHQ